MTAPDYAAPIEGWRLWLVVSSRRRVALRSVFFDELWTPAEPFAATCHARRPHLLPWRHDAPHDAPDADCLCGIYAATSLAPVAEYLRRGIAPTLCWAIGRVALWGRVVECSRGWRASLAYPSRIVVPTRQEPWRRRDRDGYAHILAGLRAYEVPVELVDGAADELLSGALAA